MIQSIQGLLRVLRMVFRMKVVLYRWGVPGVLFILIILLSACGVPEPIEGVPTLNVTQAYQTVQARLTQATVLTSTPTETLQPTPLLTATPDPVQNGSTQDPVRTVSPTPTEICDKAAPGNPMIDVNIEDGTEMQPGQRFIKIWRLNNAGACTWTREYQAIWFFGTKLGDSSAVPLTRNVNPGESIEIEVEMVAPQNPGTYRSDWKLQNSSGESFGIGPTGNSTFWVQIQVIQLPTETPAPTSVPTEVPPEPTSSPEFTETATPSVVFKVSTNLLLFPSSQIDLDNGQVNPEGGADLSYQPDENGNHWLTPANEFLLGVFGSSQPTIEICQSATMSTAAIAVGSISPGTYLCYQTNGGLPGWLKLVGFNEADASIEIDVLTWELPEE